MKFLPILPYRRNGRKHRLWWLTGNLVLQQLRGFYRGQELEALSTELIVAHDHDSLIRPDSRCSTASYMGERTSESVTSQVSIIMLLCQLTTGDADDREQDPVFSRLLATLGRCWHHQS